jgi:hypothetical protein
MSAFAALAAARAAGVGLILERGELIAEAPKVPAEVVAPGSSRTRATVR